MSMFRVFLLLSTGLTYYLTHSKSVRDGFDSWFRQMLKGVFTDAIFRNPSLDKITAKALYDLT